MIFFARRLICAVTFSNHRQILREDLFFYKPEAAYLLNPNFLMIS